MLLATFASLRWNRTPHCQLGNLPTRTVDLYGVFWVSTSCRSLGCACEALWLRFEAPRLPYRAPALDRFKLRSLALAAARGPPYSLSLGITHPGKTLYPKKLCR